MRGLRFFVALVAALGVDAATANAGDSQSQPPPTPKSNSAPAPTTRNAPRAAPDGGLGMALLGARVNSGGALITGSGVVSSQNFLSSGYPGAYEVVFNRNVTNCVYNATPADEAAIAVMTQPRFLTPNGVFLRFRNTTDNTLRNTEFYLTVFCGN